MPRDFFKEAAELVNTITAFEEERRSKLPPDEQRKLRRQALILNVKDTAAGLAVGTVLLTFWSLPLVGAYMLGRWSVR